MLVLMRERTLKVLREWEILAVNSDSTVEVFHGLSTGQIESADGFRLPEQYADSPVSCSIAPTLFGKVSASEESLGMRLTTSLIRVHLGLTNSVLIVTRPQFPGVNLPSRHMSKSPRPSPPYLRETLIKLECCYSQVEIEHLRNTSQLIWGKGLPETWKEVYTGYSLLSPLLRSCRGFRGPLV